MPIYTVIGQIETSEGNSHAENLAEIAEKIATGLTQGGFPRHSFSLSIATPKEREEFQKKVGEVPTTEPFKVGDKIQLKHTDCLFDSVNSLKITGTIVGCRGWHKSKLEEKGGYFYYDLELDLPFYSNYRRVSRADYELVKLIIR